MWRAVDAARRSTMNVLFLAFIVLICFSSFRTKGPEFADKNALVMAPSGYLVEQLGGDPQSRMLGALTGDGGPDEVLLKDLIDTLEAAAEDDRIELVLLDLSNFAGGGLTKLQDLGNAIEAFRGSGKRVIATADGYSQGGYYVAAHADEVFINPLGMVELVGFGRYRTYYGDALDRLKVDWHVFKVGTFKSAVEPYLRGSMSDEAKEANMAYLTDVWGAFLADVAGARNLDPDTVRDYAEHYDHHLIEADGDAAEAALAASLVDRVATRDEVRDHIIGLVGENQEKHSYHRVGATAYLEAHRAEHPEPTDGDAVGVIVARGTISGGTRGPGAIGGDSLAALVRQARHDKRIKAVVLRVDSPGGSVFGSEVARRELELLRESGKPLIASMGSYAASGGYWISTPADEIWAHPTTLTGSIGIFGMYPTFERALQQFAGVRVDGVGNTELAGVRPERALPQQVSKLRQAGIERGYRRFIGLVAASRGMTPEEVDEVAQGRIWSGEDALEHGLVDQLGNLEGAIARAAELAELTEPATVLVEPKAGWRERLARSLFEAGAQVGVDLRATAQPDPGFAPLAKLWGTLSREARALAAISDPDGLYAFDLRLVGSMESRVE